MWRPERLSGLPTVILYLISWDRVSHWTRLELAGLARLVRHWAWKILLAPPWCSILWPCLALHGYWAAKLTSCFHSSHLPSSLMDLSAVKESLFGQCAGHWSHLAIDHSYCNCGMHCSRIWSDPGVYHLCPVDHMCLKMAVSAAQHICSWPCPVAVSAGRQFEAGGWWWCAGNRVSASCLC